MNQLQTQRIDKLEVEINYYKAQTAQNIIEIGNRLIEAKELLPHGEWGNWLEIKVDFSDRRARQFMQVAREFGNRQLSSDLSLDKMLLLTNIEADIFTKSTDRRLL